MNTKIMELKEKNKVNVAPSSDEGHYVEGAKNVINLDEPINESYIVEGESKLVTKNHTSLNMKDDCLINTQHVFNPFSESYQKVRD